MIRNEVFQKNQVMKILLITGEHSGDTHGAELIRTIRTCSDNVTIYAAGGPKVKQASDHFIYDLTGAHAFGFWEVLSKIFKSLLVHFFQTITLIVKFEKAYLSP